MKIAVPVVDLNNKKYCIENEFHSPSFLCIYDSKEGEYSWVKTKEIDNLLKYFQSSGLSAIITRVMPPATLSILNRIGIHVYKSDSSDLIHNLVSFQHDELENYTPEDALKHFPVCGSGCDTCSTVCSKKN